MNRCRARRMFNWLIVISLFLIGFSGIASAPVPTSNTKVLAHFDDSSNIVLDYGANTAITAYGVPEIITDGKHGNCLSLDSGDYITFDASSNLGSFNEGTIMFWVRPHWTNNQSVSHSFCSMLLYNDGDNGYMVMSDGWWESGGGANSIYFIANNQFGLTTLTTDSDTPLVANEWYHMAMTYRFNGTEDSFVKMYINGELIKTDTVTSNVPGICSPRGNFQIGTSAGIWNSELRYADADFDEFVILDTALSELEMTAEYQNQNKKEIIAHFDRTTIALDEASADKNVSLSGSPTIISGGVIGNCLSLDSGDYITFNADNNLGSFSEGTIMFWVRPHWNNNQSVSHTFCSMLLYNEGDDGYMVMSDGWWESTCGDNCIYSIANNRFGLITLTTDTNTPLVANEWYHMAMTFRFNGEDDSFVKMYINGELISTDTSTAGTPGICSPRGNFQIGTSAGIWNSELRYADADFDEFYCSNVLMLKEEIKDVYDRQSGESAKIQASFANGIKIDSANEPDNYNVIGTPQLTHSGMLDNRCLSLNSGDYITFNADNNLGSFNEGTIMFWVRPHWTNNQSVSHSFCSMLLYNDGDNGYMVMSDGWWESTCGDNCIYSIANNRFGLNTLTTDANTPLVANEWYHMAMTYRFNGTEDSFVKMYINGELISSDTSTAGTPGICSPRGNFQIGTSAGIWNSELRYADADICKLGILCKSLDSTTIENSYLLGSPFRMFYRDIYNIADNPYTPPTSGGNIRESRILFDADGNYDSKEAAEALVDRAKAAGFNIIMECVYHAYGARWDTSTIPVESSSYQTLIEGKEPLQYLIDYAHSQGIDVHAWFTVNKCYSNMISTYSAAGWIDASFLDEYGNYKLIVQHPGFRDFISDLMLEVVENYNVDGINLDYIRARGWCTTQYCQDDYYAKNGRNLINDIAADEYEYLGEWTYDAVTDIVQRVNTKCKAENPAIQISACVELNADKPLTNYFALQGRDGISWVNDDLIDFTLSMEYSLRPNYDNFRERVNEFTGGADGKVGFIISNYERVDGQVLSRNADYTATLFSFGQRMNTGVVGCFWYRALSDEQISVIKGRPFKDTAVPYYK